MDQDYKYGCNSTKVADEIIFFCHDVKVGILLSIKIIYYGPPPM